MTTELEWIAADWEAPSNIYAGTTTRAGGTSLAPFDSFNLAGHVGDSDETVTDNRQLLQTFLELPNEPVWLQQTHSNRIIKLQQTTDDRHADGVWCNAANTVCAVMTADCLPLLLCDRLGQEIAAIHVGWRGFSKNIIHNAIASFTTRPKDLLAWIGPTISANHYEVGEEVRTACLAVMPLATDAFKPASRKGHYYADLVMLAQAQLTAADVASIYGGDYCTFTDRQRFYSYRRDGITGRTASLIWITHPATETRSGE